jgi:hypothetical protein
VVRRGVPESFAFDAVNGIRVTQHFERRQPRSESTPVRWTGAFQLMLGWDASGRESGVTVVFNTEQGARAEAERLQALLGVKPVYRAY